MSKVIVLESNDESFGEVKKSLAKTGLDFEPIRFKSPQALMDWVKQIEKTKLELKRRELLDQEVERENEQGASSSTVSPVRHVEDDDMIDLEALSISLMLVSAESIGPENRSFYKTFLKYFKKNGFLPEDSDLPIIFLVHEGEEFDIAPFMKAEYKNVIMKPIDTLAAAGKIKWAVKGIEAVNSEELHTEKPIESVELIKDVHLDRLTELGFRTTSHQTLPHGKIAKYFFPFLETSMPESHGGLLARLVEGRSHPEKDGTFENSFSFFGVNSHFARALRSYLEKRNPEARMKFPEFGELNVDPDDPCVVTIISHDENQQKRYQDYLEDHFSNVKVFAYKNILDFLIEASPDLLLETEEREGTEIKEVFLKYDGYGSQVVGIEGLSNDDLFAGLTAKELKSFKKILFEQYDEEERKEFNKYFKGVHDESKTFTLKWKDETSILTLVETQVQVVDGNKEIVVHLRDATVGEKKTYAEFNSSDARRTAALLVNADLAYRFGREYWEQIKSKISQDEKNIPLLLVGPKYPEKEIVVYDHGEFEEFFLEPIDITYFTKKVTQIVPALVPKKEQTRVFEDVRETIITSSPVFLSKISEVSVAIKYHRAIVPGRYRRIALESNEDGERREYLIRCVGSLEEKDEEGMPIHINYFVFFGVDGADGQYLRKWLNEVYQENIQGAENEKANQASGQKTKGAA